MIAGHTSIVNSTLFHPTLPHIATAGIERDVLIHGPTPGSPCVARLRRSPESRDVRRVGSGEEEGAMTSEQYWAMVLGIEAVDDNGSGEGDEKALCGSVVGSPSLMSRSYAILCCMLVAGSCRFNQSTGCGMGGCCGEKPKC